MLFVLLPVHNELEDTIGFIKCCEMQTYRDFKLVVIDDGSQDGTFEVIKGTYPWIHIIAGDGNLWWTGAINVGLEYVLDVGRATDYVMTINNDVRFDDIFFQKVTDGAMRYGDAVFNPISVYSNDKRTVFTSGTKVLSWFFAMNRKPFYGKTLHRAQEEEIISVDYLSGRGTTIPISVFHDIGVYNQKEFPHYGADEEFTLRAKRSGYRVFIDPQIVIYVDASSTGLNPSNRRLGVRELFNSFRSMRSTNNLKIVYRFSRCCVPGYAVPSHLVLSCLKRLVLGSLSFVCNKPARKLSCLAS